MPINVDPDKMREHFREHTDHNPDDPDERRAMLRAFLWMNGGALVAVLALIWLASSPGFAAVSVLAVGLAAFGIGAARYAALLYHD